MFGGCFNYFRHGYLGGGLMMFLGLLLVIAIVYYLFKNQQVTPSVNPIDLLNTKYINGDITKETYEQKLEVLKKNK